MIKRILLSQTAGRNRRPNKKSKMILFVVSVMCAAYLIRKQKDMVLFTKILNEVKSIFDIGEFKEALLYICGMLGI